MSYKDSISGIECSINVLKAKAEECRKRLGARSATKTFDNFEISRDEGAYSKCLSYAKEGYKDTKRNCLLIIGSYGTGKTHLAAAIANKLIDEGVQVKFGTYISLLEGIKDEFGDKDRQALKELKTAELLIMDDIGKERVTDWTRSTMFDVVNARYNDMLPTVFTTNLTMESLKEYLGGAVYSRICETSTGVKTTAEDYRKLKD